MIKVFKVIYDSVIKNFWNWVVIGFLWFFIRFVMIFLVALLGLIAGTGMLIGNTISFVYKETKIALGVEDGSKH